MSNSFPPTFGRIVDRAFRFQPGDLRHVLDRIHAHAIEPRMPRDELEAAARVLGYSSVHAFGHAIGLPIRTIDAWLRLGVPQESAQLVRALVAMKDRFTEAAEEFDAFTHAGLADYLKDKRV